MQTHQWRVITLCLALVAAVVFVPGIVAAESGVQGVVTVESDETVSSITGIYGTVVVEGTVTGDVSALAGDVVVAEGGTVEGDISVAAGSLRIEGTVGGEVSAGVGTLHITETATVGGPLSIGGADIRIDGTVNGDTTIGADTIQLGDNAEIAGSLTYDGSLSGNLDAVAGEITRDRSLGAGLVSDIQPFATWAFALSAFVLNLILGTLLLLLAPNFSNRVAHTVTDSPLRSGAVGFAFLVSVPILFFIVALTIIGIPFVLGGAVLFALVLWVGLVYGRFALGAWILSLFDRQHRFVALVVGLLLALALGQIPILGGILNFIIFLLGLGAFVTALVGHRRQRREQPGQHSLDEFQ